MPPSASASRQSLYLLVGVVVLAAPLVLMMAILVGNLIHQEDAIRSNIDRVQQAEDAAAAERARQHRELQARMEANFKDCLAQRKFDDAEKVIANMKLIEVDAAAITACEAALQKARTAP